MTLHSSSKEAELTNIYAWFTALAGDDLNAMDGLLARGVSVDVPHPLRHTTALMEATRRGRAATVHWLLARGATPAFLCGLPQATPLHCALKLRYWGIATLLLNATSTIAWVDEQGRTPLHVLAAESTADDILEVLPIASRLLIKRCPIDALDDEGICALHHAIINDNHALAKLLLEAGANPNSAVPDSGMTPLAMAALDKNRTIAALLMHHGANPHQPIRDGTTPVAIFPALTRLAAGVGTQFSGNSERARTCRSENAS